MTVLMPNTTAGVRRAIEDAVDDYGDQVTGGWGPLGEMLAARSKENADGTWALGLDTALLPIRVGDLVVTGDGGSYLVRSVAALRNNVDPRVDWVRISALQRSAGGTEPGGAWFVARHIDHLDPNAPDGVTPSAAAGLWTGNGPPPAYIEGAKPGEEYLDLLSGVVYLLEEQS